MGGLSSRGAWRTSARLPADVDWLGLPGTATVEELLASVDRDPHRVPRALVGVLKALAAG